MHKLSVISLVALVAVGGILAFVVFAHPAALASPGDPQTAPHATTISNGSGSNSTLLTQPPPQSSGGSDDSGYDS